MTLHHSLRALPVLLAACAVIVVYSIPAFAEGGCRHGKHGKHQMPVHADLDANGDGTVTSDEFYAFRAQRMADRAKEGGKLKHAKDAPSFEDLDLDGDGDLSAEEFDKHHAQCPMHGKHTGKSEGDSA
jgi:hypothetical protein